MYEGVTEISEDKKQQLLEAYDLLEIFLKNKKYVAGNDLSIADFSIVTSINSIENLVPIDKTKYPRIISWLKQMEKLPYYDDANKNGLQMFKAMVAAKLSQ